MLVTEYPYPAIYGVLEQPDRTIRLPHPAQRGGEIIRDEERRDRVLTVLRECHGIDTA